jgi:hypothetical protein
MQPQSGIAVAAVSSQLLGDGAWPFLSAVLATVSFLVALTFHFRDYAITASTSEIHAKSENAVVREDMGEICTYHDPHALRYLSY